MLTAIDHAHDLLRGLHAIADAVLDAAPARAPARLAAATMLEADLRESVERLGLDGIGREVVQRFLLEYQESLHSISDVRVRSLGRTRAERGAALRRDGEEAHARCLIALSGIASLLREAQRADPDVATRPHHGQRFA